MVAAFAVGGCNLGQAFLSSHCLPTDCSHRHTPAEWPKTLSCAQGWEVIKEKESDKANFTRAEKKLLQYLVPVLQANWYTKTSSSTSRKKQVSSLQIADSCWKWTRLTALILFLNHLPCLLMVFHRTKLSHGALCLKLVFITMDSHLVLAHASREHQNKTCKEIFFERWEFSRENKNLTWGSDTVSGTEKGWSRFTCPSLKCGVL